MSDISSFSQRVPEAEAFADTPDVDSFQDLSTPAFRGLLPAVGNGFMRGAAELGRATGVISGGLYSNAEFASSEPAPLGTQDAHAQASDALTDHFFHGVDSYGTSAVDFWTPRATEVGRASEVVGSVAGIVPALMLGGGNPALLMGSTALNTGATLTNEGVSAPVAATAGTLEAAATGLGFKLLPFGRTLAAKLATGAGQNIALGAGSRQAEKALLESTGYDEQAKPYTTDVAAMSVDALTGLLFGGIAHFADGRISSTLTPAESDAVLTARNAKNFQETTAPGAIDSADASVAHQSAMETALSQLARNEPVDVSEVANGAKFENAENVAQSARLAQLVEGEQPKDVQFADDTVAPAPPQTGTAHSEGVALLEGHDSEALHTPSEQVDVPALKAEPEGAQPASDTAPVSSLSLEDAFGAKAETSELPEVVALQELARTNPEASIYSGHTDEGEPARASLQDVADQIHEDYTRDTKSAQAYQAAVNCFLGRGA